MIWRLHEAQDQMCVADAVHASGSPCQLLWSLLSEVSRSGGPRSSLWTVDWDIALSHSPRQPVFSLYRLILMSSGLDTTT